MQSKTELLNASIERSNDLFNNPRLTAIGGGWLASKTNPEEIKKGSVEIAVKTPIYGTFRDKYHEVHTCFLLGFVYDVHHKKLGALVLRPCPHFGTMLCQIPTDRFKPVDGKGIILPSIHSVDDKYLKHIL